MERNDNFQLVEELRPLAAEIGAIRDEIGAKIANVYLLTREEGVPDIWEQILPTPHIRDFSHSLKLVEGGEVRSGDLLLKGIPISKYSEMNLDTALMDQEDEKEKYYIIDRRAYTLVHIKKNYLTWDVLIRRWEALNSEDIGNPPPVVE